MREAMDVRGPSRQGTVQCLVSADVPDIVVARLRRFLAAGHGIEVMVDRRNGDRRRPHDRRAGPTAPARATERRRVHNLTGRRVGDRRAEVVPAESPRALPPPACEYADRLRFVERRPEAPQTAEDLDTARLVVKLQAGDVGAFDELYERYFARVYGYLRVALRDAHEAEDAAHEIFVTILQALPAYEVRESPFRVWLFKVVRNYTINQVRKLGRVEVMEPNEINRRLESGEPDLADLGAIGDAALLRLVERLPALQRQVIVLRYVMGFDVTEVAKLVGRSPNAVSQLQQRAFTILRSRLRATGRVPETRSVRLAMCMRGREALVTRARRLALSY